MTDGIGSRARPNTETVREEAIRRAVLRPTPGYGARLTIRMRVLGGREYAVRYPGGRAPAPGGEVFLVPRGDAVRWLRDGEADCGDCGQCGCAAGSGSCGHHGCAGGPGRTCPAIGTIRLTRT